MPQKATPGPQKAAPRHVPPKKNLGPPAETVGDGRARGRSARGSLRYLPPVTPCPRPRREQQGAPSPLLGGGGRREAREDPGRAPAAAPGARLRAPQRSGGASTGGCRHQGAQTTATPSPVTARSEGPALPTLIKEAQRTRQPRRDRPPPARRPHRASTAAPGPAAAILCPVYLSREPGACAARGR